MKQVVCLQLVEEMLKSSIKQERERRLRMAGEQVTQTDLI